jgi:hypothetical protein
MCTRTNGELKALARHYMAKYTHDLVADMEGDISGNFMRLMKEKAKASPRDGCRGARPPLIGRSQAEDQPGDVKSDVDKVIGAMKVCALCALERRCARRAAFVTRVRRASAATTWC